GGSALGRSGGSLTLVASLFSGNAGGGCASAPGGSIADGGGNVRVPAADASCPGTAGDPGLTPLRDNGGPVQTQAPAAGGAAIDPPARAGRPPTHAPRAAPPARGAGGARPRPPAPPPAPPRTPPPPPPPPPHP